MHHAAISEYNSAVSNPNGLDIEDCKAYFTANKTFKGYPNGQYIEDPLLVRLVACSIYIYIYIYISLS
jgi:hypothetical protein